MKKFNFLVVDDAPVMRSVLKNSIAKDIVNNVYEVESGIDAIALLHEKPVDMVITDWNMPEMEGLQLVKTIRADDSFKELRIIMVTVRGRKQDIIKAFRAKIDDYIVKPIDRKVLNEKIVKILEKKGDWIIKE